MSADFLDSNVILYLFDDTDEFKRQIATSLIQRSLAQASGVISFQVVQETLNVITRKLEEPVTPEDSKMFLHEVLLPLWSLMPSESLYRRALDIQVRYQYGFYDSLIVSAAVEGGCKRLYSEDLHGGQVIEGLRITNPFRR